MLLRRVSISGSLIGGMKDTQDCIDFCAERGILPATELVGGRRIRSRKGSRSRRNRHRRWSEPN